jgi:NAD(P)H-dependent FMN reductase/ketosteroid isomerase-like protein
MTKPTDVALIIGSLRKASVTRKVANALMAAAPASLTCRIIEIGALEIYNQDLDDVPPASWVSFRRQVQAAQAVIILTPEYNRSIPACLKNALDVGSRPQGKNLWDGKPAGVVSVTPYKLGAFGANHHVRQSLVYLNMPAMQQPEAYVAGAAELFDEQGQVRSEESRKFFQQFMVAFAKWTGTLLGQAPDADFDDFMARRAQVAAAYSNGDAEPLHGITAQTGTTTFFPPSGGFIAGAREVTHRYDEDAKIFSPGAHSSLEIFDSGTSGQLAFWTGLQDFAGTVRGKPAKMKLRITEIFKLIDGGWKLVHRHADPGAEPAAHDGAK